MFTVGAGLNYIKMPYPVPLAGYQARAELAETQNDPLCARLLTVEGDGGSVAIVALDVLYVDSDLTDLLRTAVSAQTSIPPSSVMVCSTHTHSGPGLIFPNSNRYDSSIVDSIITAVSEAAGRAWSMRTACELSWASGDIVGVASIRNGVTGEAGPANQALRVAEFRSVNRNLAGVPRFVARAINFGCHATVLGPGNALVSRDWPGFMVDACEEQLRRAGVQRPFVIFLNGAAADVSTRYTRKAQTFEEAARLGRMSADQVFDVFASSGPSRTCHVCLKHESISIPRRQLPSEHCALAAISREEREAHRLASCGGSPLALKEALDRAAAWRIVLNRIRHEHGRPRNPLVAHLCLLRLGDLAMVFVPGEAPAKLGDKIRATVAEGASAPEESVWVVGYSNGHLGYISPMRAGPDGYEQLMCDLAPEATEEILTAVARLSSKGMCVDQC